jgi:hypothetical protein
VFGSCYAGLGVPQRIVSDFVDRSHCSLAGLDPSLCRFRFTEPLHAWPKNRMTNFETLRLSLRTESNLGCSHASQHTSSHSFCPRRWARKCAQDCARREVTRGETRGIKLLKNEGWAIADLPHFACEADPKPGATKFNLLMRRALPNLLRTSKGLRTGLPFPNLSQDRPLASNVTLVTARTNRRMRC